MNNKKNLIHTKKITYYYLTILRAIALIGVCLYHLFPHIIKGGFLGVIIFLSLSGLLMERAIIEKNKELNIKDTIRSIIKRLIKILTPTLFVMAISLILAIIFARNIFDDSIRSAIPIALGFENIREIIKGVSYFERNGNFNLFTHLWYIAIYVQFIIIFNLLEFFMQKIKNINKTIIFSFLTLFSFALTYYLAINNAQVIRIYYGTDTRISAFLSGSVGFLLISKINFENLSKKAFQYILLTLTVLIIIPFFLIEGQNLWIYEAFFMGYTLMVTVLVAFVYKYETLYPIKLRNLNMIGRVAEYLGNRSFYIYLRQYVVQIFFAYLLSNVISNRIIFLLLQVILVLILSELTHLIFYKNRNKKYYIIILSIIIVILTGISFKIGNQKAQQLDELQKKMEESKAKTAKDNEAIKNNTSSKDNNITKNKNNKVKDINFKEKSFDDFDFSKEELNFLKNESITAIGDSVLINIDSYLREYTPSLYLDGEVGRDMTSAPDILSSIKNNVGLSDNILIALGSNGSADPSDMKAIMDIADGRDVYFVNTSHLQPYMDHINDEIKKFTEENENAYLIDRRSFAKNRDDIFAPDRVHPNVEGSEDYAKIIIRKILNVNKL